MRGGARLASVQPAVVTVDPGGPDQVSTEAAQSSPSLETLALYRRATNYIAVAMIYLQDNHLLREPLQHDHVKHRLLGHWGTVPGLNLVYALATGFGAALDNPDLMVAAIIGDGEAETGPTAGAWHCNKFLNPAGDGAVLPVLHLNGYKIANPTIYKSMSDEELTKLFEGYGWHPLIVGGPTEQLDSALAGAIDTAHGEIRELQEQVRSGGSRPERPRWPMIVLQSPKGWTGPKEVDGIKVEGTSKAHQVPAMKAKTDPGHLKILEDWLRSYGPADLVDENGGPIPEILSLCTTGELRMGANPNVNAGKLRKDIKLPYLDKHALDLP